MDSQKFLSHEFLLEQQKTYQGGKSLTQKRLRGPTTWKVMLRKSWKDTASWQKKKEQMYNVSTACLDNHNFKKGELETVGELSDVFHKSSSHACAWHELIDQTYCEQ